MAIPAELIAFVKEALTKGLPRPAIQQALRQAGWEAEQVEAALGTFSDADFAIPVPRPVPYLSARESFLYLLLFTTLYLSAFNLGQIAFQLINLGFPDAADPAYVASPARIREALRWGIASLIVAFPVFLYLSRLTAAEIRKDPAKRASKVRRWLTYLTLFLAASVVIGDLISLLYNLLSGELTIRFGLKVAAVAVIAGGCFTYYLRDIRTAGEEAVP